MESEIKRHITNLGIDDNTDLNKVIDEFEKVVEKQKNDEEEFNMDDYTLAPEETPENKYYVDLLNCFIIYYKKLNNVPEKVNMFENIDYDKLSSTNKQMENFSALMDEATKNDTITIQDPDEVDITKVDNLYALMVDDDIIKVCTIVFPLLEFVTELEWNKISWSIVPLK